MISVVNRTAIVALCLFAACECSTLADGPRYRRVLLPTLPAPEPATRVHDINDSGAVCGESRTYANYQAIIWDQTVGIRLLGDLVEGQIAAPEDAQAINEQSQISGMSGFPDGSGFTAQAYFWSREDGMIGLGDLPGSTFSSRAKGLNNLGHVVGYSCSNRYGEDMQEAFLWTPENGMVGLGTLVGSGRWSSFAEAINDTGWITGNSDSPLGIEAFIWTPETGMVGLGDLDGGFSYSFGESINAFGQIAGNCDSIDAPGGVEAFLWSPEEGMMGLGVLPGHDYSLAIDVNEREQVVGRCLTFAYAPTAFVWDRQRGMRSLSAMLDPCVPAWQRAVGTGYAINNHGQIVADGSGGGLFLDPYIPGDLDSDGAVTLQDLATLLSNFGRAGDVGYIQGDIHNCDRDVDLEDLATLLENFGQTLD